MFTGIIESTQIITEVTEKDQSLTIHINKPDFFNDIKVGDSIAVDGVCLTLESFGNEMIFTLGLETLKILNWKKETLLNKTVNLERSLRFGDRIHGHLVSGHVDGTTKLIKRQDSGDCLLLDFQMPSNFEIYFWKKGSITVNGVSLTINEITAKAFSVCLIPETIKKTNLEKLAVNEIVSFECDCFMKGFLNARKYTGADVSFY